MFIVLIFTNYISVQINKMIRYISEREVQLNPTKEAKKYRSNEKPMESFSPNIEAQEDFSNSSKALKILKKVNDQSEMLKGRLSVLQIQEQKNDFRAYLNSQRYKFHRHMRNQMEKQRQQKAEHLKKVIQKLNQSQEQAKQERIQHQINLKKAQNQLYNKNFYEYKKSKQMTEQIQNNISLYRQSEQYKNKQKKQEIREYQKSQKIHVASYLQHKKKQFKSTDSVDSMRLLMVAQERRKQIESLVKIESEMLERQARSKLSSEQSHKKLKDLLSNKKAISTSHSTKLPQLNSERKNLTQQDILIL